MCPTGPLCIGDTHGFRAEISPLGATIRRLYVPCGTEVRQVLPVYQDETGYLTDAVYLGCIIGRTVNRVAGASITRDGVTYLLSRNDGENSLHGGRDGFNRHIWSVESHNDDRLKLSLDSPDGDQGYPGRLVATVEFRIESPNHLIINYEATCDLACPLDLTHHLYVNLGTDEQRIEDHSLQVDGTQYLETRDDYTATGECLSVAGTPFDFRDWKTIGAALVTPHPQLRPIGLNQALFHSTSQTSMKMMSPDWLLMLEVQSNQPTVQLYSGLSRGISPMGALAIEPQGFIDAANIRHFPSAWIEPGQRFSRTTRYIFVDRSQPV